MLLIIMSNNNFGRLPEKKIGSMLNINLPRKPFPPALQVSAPNDREMKKITNTIKEHLKNKELQFTQDIQKKLAGIELGRKTEKEFEPLILQQKIENAKNILSALLKKIFVGRTDITAQDIRTAIERNKSSFDADTLQLINKLTDSVLLGVGQRALNEADILFRLEQIATSLSAQAPTGSITGLPPPPVATPLPRPPTGQLVGTPPRQQDVDDVGVVSPEVRERFERRTQETYIPPTAKDEEIVGELTRNFKTLMFDREFLQELEEAKAPQSYGFFIENLRNTKPIFNNILEKTIRSVVRNLKGDFVKKLDKISLTSILLYAVMTAMYGASLIPEQREEAFGLESTSPIRNLPAEQFLSRLRQQNYDAFMGDRDVIAFLDNEQEKAKVLANRLELFDSFIHDEGVAFGDTLFADYMEGALREIKEFIDILPPPQPQPLPLAPAPAQVAPPPADVAPTGSGITPKPKAVRKPRAKSAPKPKPKPKGKGRGVKKVIDEVKETAPKSKGKFLMFKRLKDLKERLNLLVGNVKSGNNSKEVLNEISDLLDFLLQNKYMSKRNHTKIFKDIGII
jgi:hypothetical protein